MEFTDRELERLISIINLFENMVLDRNMRLIPTYETLSLSEKGKEIVKKWNDETIDEWVELNNLKRKFEKIKNKEMK